MDTNIFWKSFFVGALVFGYLGVMSADASETKPAFFMDGNTVRVTGNSEPIPGKGIDPLYFVTNGASDQIPVAGIAPGDGSYARGQWAVSMVTFAPEVEPYLLFSEADVLEAKARGLLTVERAAELDRRLEVI